MTFFFLKKIKEGDDNNEEGLSDSGDSLDEDIDFNQITFDEVDGISACNLKRDKN